MLNCMGVTQPDDNISIEIFGFRIGVKTSIENKKKMLRKIAKLTPMVVFTVKTCYNYYKQ